MRKTQIIQDQNIPKSFATAFGEGFDLPSTAIFSQDFDHYKNKQKLDDAQKAIQNCFTTLLQKALSSSKTLPGNVSHFLNADAVSVTLNYDDKKNVYTATVKFTVNFVIDGVTSLVNLGQGFECQFSKKKSQGIFAVVQKEKYCLSEIRYANEDASLFDALAGLSTGNSTYDQYKSNAYLFDQILKTLKTLSDEALIRHRASLMQFAKNFDWQRASSNDRRAEILFDRIAKYFSNKSLDDVFVVVADNLRQPTVFQSLQFKIEGAGKPSHNSTTNQTEMYYYAEPEKTNVIRAGVVVNPQRYISLSLKEKIKNTLENKIRSLLSAGASVSIAIEEKASLAGESTAEFSYSYEITAIIAGVSVLLGDLTCAVSKFNSTLQPLAIGHATVVTQISAKHSSFPIVLALLSEKAAENYQQPSGYPYTKRFVDASIKKYLFEQATQANPNRSWQQVFGVSDDDSVKYSDQKKRAPIDLLVNAFKQLSFTAEQNVDQITAIFQRIATVYLPQNSENKNVEDYFRVLSETAYVICDFLTNVNGMALKDKATIRQTVWDLASQDVDRALQISLTDSQRNALSKAKTIISDEVTHVSDRAHTPHTPKDLIAQSPQSSQQRTEAEEPLPATVSSGVFDEQRAAPKKTYSATITPDALEKNLKENFTRESFFGEWKFCKSDTVSPNLKIDDAVYNLLANPKKAKKDFDNNRTPATLKRLLEAAYKSYKKLHAVQPAGADAAVKQPAPVASARPERSEHDAATALPVTSRLEDAWIRRSSDADLQQPLTNFLGEDKALEASSWKALVEQKGRNRPTFFRGLRIYALEDITIENVDFSGYDLSNCKFFGAENKKIIFKNCKFKGANLSDAQFDCAVELTGTTTISGAKTAGAVAREWSTESPVNTLFYEPKESRRGLQVTERFSYSVQVDARSRPRRVWDWLLTPIRALTKSRLPLRASIKVLEQKQFDGSVTLMLFFVKSGEKKSAPGIRIITDKDQTVIDTLLGAGVNKRPAVFQNKNFTGLPPHQQMLMILQYAEEHPSSKIAVAVAVDWFISTSTATTTTTSAPSSSSVALPVVSSVSVPPIPTMTMTMMTGAEFRTRIEEIIKNKKASRAIANCKVTSDVDLHGLDLSGFKFTNITFNNNAIFQNAKLINALFTNVTFEADVDFSSANIAGMKLRDTTVADTMITDDQTVRVDRTHVDAGITSTTTGSKKTKYQQIANMRYNLQLSRSVGAAATQIDVQYHLGKCITIFPVSGAADPHLSLTALANFDDFYANIKTNYLANKPFFEFNKITQAEKLFPHNTSGTDDESIHTAIRRIEYLLSCAQSESKQKNSAIRNAFDSAITFLIPTRAAAAAATATTETTVTVIVSPNTSTTASPSQPAVQPPEEPPAVAAAEPSTTTDTSKKPFNDLDDDVPLHAATPSNLPAAAASASPAGNTETPLQKEEEVVAATSRPKSPTPPSPQAVAAASVSDADEVPQHADEKRKYSQSQAKIPVVLPSISPKFTDFDCNPLYQLNNWLSLVRSENLPIIVSPAQKKTLSEQFENLQKQYPQQSALLDHVWSNCIYTEEQLLNKGGTLQQLRAAALATRDLFSQEIEKIKNTGQQLTATAAPAAQPPASNTGKKPTTPPQSPALVTTPATPSKSAALVELKSAQEIVACWAEIMTLRTQKKADEQNQRSGAAWDVQIHKKTEAVVCGLKKLLSSENANLDHRQFELIFQDVKKLYVQKIQGGIAIFPPLSGLIEALKKIPKFKTAFEDLDYKFGYLHLHPIVPVLQKIAHTKGDYVYYFDPLFQLRGFLLSSQGASPIIVSSDQQKILLSTFDSLRGEYPWCMQQLSALRDCVYTQDQLLEKDMTLQDICKHASIAINTFSESVAFHQQFCVKSTQHIEERFNAILEKLWRFENFQNVKVGNSVGAHISQHDYLWKNITKDKVVVSLLQGLDCVSYAVLTQQLQQQHNNNSLPFPTCNACSKDNDLIPITISENERIVFTTQCQHYAFLRAVIEIEKAELYKVCYEKPAEDLEKQIRATETHLLKILNEILRDVQCCNVASRSQRRNAFGDAVYEAVKLLDPSSASAPTPITPGFGVSGDPDSTRTSGAARNGSFVAGMFPTPRTPANRGDDSRSSGSSANTPKKK